MMQYRNPVIPGFHPDPSICRVGEDYYLATSSFHYFPGVPLFRSRDLVHWEPIGHALTRESQLPLPEATAWLGIYAPTLRYHDGRFYMVTTNMSGMGNFFVHTEDPVGEWSEPVLVDAAGFDPDLFWDDDGKVYYSHHNLPGPYISQWEIDIATGKLVSEERVIWKGHEDRLCEAPHLYKIDGRYYLIAAEGGTHEGHMITCGRSDAPTGPFEPCPHNPILTHRASIGHPIQHTGHGDLVEDVNGNWWMVFLAVRWPSGFNSHFLGRETYLAPVTWEDGWPVVNSGARITETMAGPDLPLFPVEAPPVRDELSGGALGFHWNFLCNPNAEDWSLEHGRLHLQGNRLTLDDLGSPAFVGRRQQHFDCRAGCLLRFAPIEDGEEAGLTAYMSHLCHYEIALCRRNGERRVVVRRRIGDLSAVVASQPWCFDEVELELDATAHCYMFSAGVPGQQKLTLAQADPQYLACKTAPSFTGVYFGMYATGAGKRCRTPARFEWFDYEPRS